MLTRAILTAFSVSILFTGAASAQDTACEERGTNGMVTLVLCPQGLDTAAWKDAGVAACGMRKPCGAWIWDDVKNMPALAPDSHDKLSKAQVSSAVAIWVNEKQELITLEKTSN